MPDHARHDGEPPYSETLVMRQKLDTWKADAPRASVMTGPFLEAAVRPLLDLVDGLAAMRTDDECAPDGLSGDDAAETLGSMITWARRFSYARPDPSTVNTGDDSR